MTIGLFSFRDREGDVPERSHVVPSLPLLRGMLGGAMVRVIRRKVIAEPVRAVKAEDKRLAKGGAVVTTLEWRRT